MRNNALWIQRSEMGNIGFDVKARYNLFNVISFGLKSKEGRLVKDLVFKEYFR